jgi:hypothetical protein
MGGCGREPTAVVEHMPNHPRHFIIDKCDASAEGWWGSMFMPLSADHKLGAGDSGNLQRGIGEVVVAGVVQVNA